MKKDFSGKVALVTGAASGIGLRAAQMFSDEGALVVLADIREDALKKAQQTISGDSIAVQLNVAEADAWKSCIAKTQEKFKGLDVVLNAAGIARVGSVESISLEDWDAQIAINLTGTFLGCRYGMAAMRETGRGGAIVNVSSVAGLIGSDDIAGYVASKGGVTMLTKAVALHGANQRPTIRCNSIHPGYVDTQILDPMADRFPSRQDFIDMLASRVPLGRVCTTDDIGNLVLFLSSDKSAMITGTNVLIDGGQIAGATPPTK